MWIAVMDRILMNEPSTSWLMMLIIAASVVSFHLTGAWMSVVLCSMVLWTMTNDFNPVLYSSYLLFGLGIYSIRLYVRRLRLQRDQWLDMLTVNSKQLNVTKEVSQAMQQTFEVKRLLETIITSMTAGHGLGYNRAMIFLLSEDGKRLKGIMGTGPITAEEGYDIWQDMTEKRFEFTDLIEQTVEDKASDRQLNDYVQTLDLPLDQDNVLSRVIKSGQPELIHKINFNDPVMALLSAELNVEEFAAIPLINQRVKSGLVLVDNLVNKKPLTMNDIDIITPLATQAAIALQQASRYENIEQMALKDGLTNLLNQRAFQQALDVDFAHRPCSIVLLDIDHFKHYNDTNGHMLGNDVLVQLADLIRSTIRSNDLAFRFGGEEFVIILPTANEQKAIAAAERLRSNVEKEIFPCGENQPGGCLTVSIGVARSDGTVDPMEIVELADQALYQAKNSGKNCVAVWQEA
ncbi:GGDEF domain-containing protein [Jeotgalibacillus aurantiacus]|uniref:GGDEF domain-containing protein n=1 Tax=Jeotgalibacillus aurantiacus TaxID=2763266 RepID=UPI001D0B5B9E|nr:sensor domain-containing diguanylate cyclase [Jeotgalibacillus aurantiacus]